MKAQECGTTEHKQCSQCGEIQALTEFSRRRRNPKAEYKHLTVCKTCIRARDRAKYQENPEPKKAARKRYAEGNRGAINAKAADYREDNRGAINVKAAEFREANRGILADRGRAWYLQADKVRIAERKRIYRLANLDKIREGQQRWDAANRDKIHDQYLRNYAKNSGTFAKNALKRARVKAQAIPRWFDAETVNAVYSEAKRLSEEYGIQYHVDHIVPLNNDKVCGLHTFDNLQILTAEENLRKSNKFYG